MTRKNKWIFLILILMVSSPRAEIIIDGKLNEKEWQNAQVLNDFYVTVPFSLEPTPLETQTLFYSDDDGLYVAFINAQDEETRDRRKHQRDNLMQTYDRNVVVVDFDNNGSTAYMLGISLGNSLIDYTITNENQVDGDWDGEWFAKTSESDENWYSEFFIPWTMVPMSLQEGEKRTIGVSVSRQIRYLGNYVAFPKVTPQRPKFLSELHKIQVVKSNPSRLDFFPYLVAKNNFIDDDATFDAGAEIFYNNGRGGEISATINPDFGQVESDNIVINFSPRETFYSDKRPFFTQSQSIFDVSLDWYPGFELYSLLHTRRIGDAPNYNCSRYSPAEGGSDELVSECEDNKINNNGIDTAIKYTQIGENTDFGFFSAFESDENFSEGKDFFAFRTLHRKNEHKIGYMVTHAEKSFINRQATVNAIDYQYLPSERIKIESLAMVSNSNEEEAGFGSRTAISFNPSKEWRYGAELYYFNEDLNINDMGYLWRNNLASYGASVNYTRTDFPEDSPINNRSYNFDYWDQNNAANDNLAEFYTLFFRQSFKDTSSFGINIFAKGEGKDDEITRGSLVAPVVKLGSGHNIELSYHSPIYGFWQYHLGFAYDFNDYYAFEDKKRRIGGGLTYMPQDNLRFWMRFGHSTRTNWLTHLSDNHFGTFNQTRSNMNIGARWYPSEKQELQLKLEMLAFRNQDGQGWFVDSSGFMVSQEQTEESINIGNISFQIRYKYEIAPLSNFYFVYTRGGGYYFDDEANTSKIISTTWREPEGNRLAAKVRIRF